MCEQTNLPNRLEFNHQHISLLLFGYNMFGSLFSLHFSSLCLFLAHNLQVIKDDVSSHAWLVTCLPSRGVCVCCLCIYGHAWMAICLFVLQRLRGASEI